jgi:hypothetical protein
MRLSRIATRTGGFIRSNRTVTQPLAVRASITGPFQRKWSLHAWVRGENSGVRVSVSGPMEAMSLPLARLQSKHAYAKFSLVVRPPCFSAMI